MEYVKIIAGPTLGELREGSMRKIMEFTVNINGKEEKKTDLVEIEEFRDGSVVVTGARGWKGEYIPLTK